MPHVDLAQYTVMWSDLHMAMGSPALLTRPKISAEPFLTTFCDRAMLGLSMREQYLCILEEAMKSWLVHRVPYCK